MKPNVSAVLPLLVLILLCMGCAEKKPAVVLHTHDGSASVTVDVELARTAGQRAMGLMYRTKLGRMRGMLFLFEQEQIHSFTMHNTLIPLDIIFMDSSGTVIGIIADTQPYARGPFCIGIPSRYVLEVNAGFCARHGIRPGDRATFVNIPGHESQTLR